MHVVTNPIAADACCASCGSGASEAQDTVLAIACTLGAGDFKDRVAGIRDLASRSLRESKRGPLTLSLTYEVEALGEVEELMAKESECCAFLDFQLRQDDQGVHLTITAPSSALPAADELFAHFAPELARVMA